VNQEFMDEVQTAAKEKGMPVIRRQALNLGSELTSREDIEAGIGDAISGIIDSLTSPLSAHEKAPVNAAETAPRVAFKGDYENINRFFFRKGWTDGLPVIPPTEKAVMEMMEGTDLTADHPVAAIPPMNGKATVEKIAVNAVMAGALPVHLPVIIAAVEALADPESGFETFETGKGSWGPLFILNGPIRNQIHLNTGSDMLSPGTLANAAIGRAIGLIIQNIGGVRKGIEDMGTLGNPLKDTTVIGENEEESPWNPLHMDKGFKSEDNTLTFFFPNSFTQAVTRGTDAKAAADAISGLNPGGVSCVVLNPQQAEILASEGWDKDKLINFLTDKSEKSQGGKDTDRLMVVVAGGPGKWTGLLKSVGDMNSAFITKRIILPGNWDKLVKKYGNMVPLHIRY
jgi:hypothetical protein